MLRLRLTDVTGRWDKERLDQVITNLVSNAIKYGNRQPVDVELDERRGMAALVVRDHGIGIPPDSQAGLFERFERGTNTRTFKGIGLGLWIAKKMVDAHGGTISVESAPGSGSTFTVTIPTSPRG